MKKLPSTVNGCRSCPYHRPLSQHKSEKCVHPPLRVRLIRGGMAERALFEECPLEDAECLDPRGPTELEAENAELRNRIKEMEDDDSHEGQVAFANDQADAWRVKCAKHRESLAWYEAKFEAVREVLDDWENDIDYYQYGYCVQLADCRDALKAALEDEES